MTEIDRRFWINGRTPGHADRGSFESEEAMSVVLSVFFIFCFGIVVGLFLGVWAVIQAETKQIKNELGEIVDL